MIEINLVGTYASQKAGKGDINNSQILALSLVAIILVEVVVLVLFTFHFNNRIELLTQKRNELKSVEKEVKVIKAKLKEVNSMIVTIKNLDKNRGEAYKNLKNVADIIPNGLWLTKLTKKGNKLEIEGKSFTTESVAKYMTNLEHVKNVSKVRFNKSGLIRASRKMGNDVYKFYILVILKG